MRNRILNIILVTAVAVGLLVNAQAVKADPWVHPSQLLVNPGFQNGLNGWTYSWHNAKGEGAAQGNLVTSSLEYDSHYYNILPPPGNTHFALLTAGDFKQTPTTLSQNFTAAAGQSLVGWACFGGMDSGKYNDYSAIYIQNVNGANRHRIWYADVNSVNGCQNSGWRTWYYQINTPGSYTLLAQVANVGDSNGSSVLGVSAFCSEVPTSNAVHFSINHVGAGSGSTSVIQNGEAVQPGLNNLDGYYFDPGASLEAIATPEPGSYFAGWTDLYGGFLSTSSSLDLNLTGATVVNADFEPVPNNPFYLHLNINGSGSVLAMVDGVPVDLNQYPFAVVTDESGSTSNKDVILTAQASSGWVFQGWNQRTGTIDPNDPTTIEIPLTEARTVTATFISTGLNSSTSSPVSVSGNLTGQ